MTTPAGPRYGRGGTAPAGTIAAPTPGHVAWPHHDPGAGIPVLPAPVRGIPPVRWPQGSLEWLIAIASVPADPVAVPSGGTGGLVESGQLILFGGSLVNAGPGAGHINLFDGVDLKGTQIVSLDVPAPAVTPSTSTATGSITSGAGSAALPNGVPVTGFTVTFSAPPSTAGTLVLSNVTGGPYTFNVTTTPQNPYTVSFPNSITATSGSVAPTLTAAGLGTGAGTIELYGQSLATAASSSANLNIPRAGILCEIGLFAQVTFGSVTGPVYIGHVWKYPFTPPGE